MNGDTQYVSASSAKAIWVAAALYDRTIADVSPFASPVIGIVTAANGRDYAVALLLSGAPSQAAYDAKQLPVLEYASCVVYHAVSGDADPFGPCTPP